MKNALLINRCRGYNTTVMNERSIPTMRQRAIQGTLFLTARQGLSVVMGVVGLLYMTRIVGPTGYGLYAAAFGVARYITLLSEGGVHMYLLRMPSDAPKKIFHLAFWWLLFLSITFVFLVMAILGAIGLLQPQMGNLIAVVSVLSGTLPLSLLSGVPMALAERALEYRKVAMVEILSQSAYYSIGIATALGGWGVWAFVSAYWASQLVLFFGYYLIVRFRPRWYWEWSEIKRLTSESLKLGIAAWIYELRLLAPSVILLPLTSEAIVGYYGLAQRLISALSFARDAIARLSVPLYVRMQENATKLLDVVRLSSLAQLIGLAGLYLPLAITADYWMPSIFGAKWNIHAVVLAFAILAANQFYFVTFGALNQALLVVGQTHVFAKAGGAYVGMSFVLSAVLASLVPEPYKLYGFVLGISVGYIPTYYWLMHQSAKRYIGSPRYGVNLLWAAGLGVALFAPFTHYWSLLGLLVFLHPASWKAIREVKDLLLEARRAKQVAAEQ
ncbi:MAG: hypothetical protein CFK49_10045 [Armatimonadetes bacterium JP3_11]|nr:MAG: hypothetical protein CFK48_06555 [Armatimonadetes bacterium CP1_7O]OYT74109.1 MAG: hypothetical protein CFK49_10045 [Armatimonadetes bacterium JP3_11]RMH09170.1 MAG: hypothetical protein D6697_04265 [Armatimonadota bacterium]